MRCCAPSALAVVHQLRSTVFLFFWTRRCVQHSGTSVRGRFFLVSLRRRDVKAALCARGRFHLSFRGEKLPHRWQELKLECLWLKMEAVWASSPQTLPKKQESRLPSVLHAASLRAARHSRVRAWWAYRPRQRAVNNSVDRCDSLASSRVSARRLYRPRDCSPTNPRVFGRVRFAVRAVRPSCRSPWLSKQGSRRKSRKHKTASVRRRPNASRSAAASRRRHGPRRQRRRRSHAACVRIMV